MRGGGLLLAAHTDDSARVDNQNQRRPRQNVGVQMIKRGFSGRAGNVRGRLDKLQSGSVIGQQWVMMIRHFALPMSAATSGAGVTSCVHP